MPSGLAVGCFVVASDQSVPIGEVARAIEDHGLDSLWLGEHSHMPIDTVYPHSRDGQVPDLIRRMLDPLVSLSAAAACTSRIRLGTSVILAAEHNPLHLAKQIATLDHLSGGRLEIGVGYGWNTLETANHQIPPRRRRAACREKIGAMRALWTDDVAAFQGEFVSFTESWAWPKPKQRPGPPVHFGGPPTAACFTDIVELGDGWMPLRAKSADGMCGSIAHLRDEFKRAGRSESPALTLFDPDGAMGNGKSDRVLDFFDRRVPTVMALAEWHSLGIERVVLGVPTDNDAVMHTALRAITDVLERYQRA